MYISIKTISGLHKLTIFIYLTKGLGAPTKNETQRMLVWWLTDVTYMYWSKADASQRYDEPEVSDGGGASTNGFSSRALFSN